MRLREFRCSLREAYPRRVKRAMDAFIPFANLDFQRVLIQAKQQSSH
jgi:hypothetical protein